GAGPGGQLGVGVALTKAVATSAGTVAARLVDATITSAGDVTVTAASDRAIESTAVSVVASIAIQFGVPPLSASAAVATLTAENRVTGTTVAAIDGGTVTAAGDIDVVADEVVVLDAGIGAGGLSVGLLSGTATVLGVTNAIDTDVIARIDGAEVTSTNGSVTVTATADDDIRRTENGTVGVSISIGGSGTDQVAEATITGDTQALVIGGATVRAHDVVAVAATSDATVDIDTFGGTGAVGVAALLVKTTASSERATLAWVADGTSVEAG